MADLRAEQIVVAVIALLTGSVDPRPTSAGAKVYRGPTDPLSVDEHNDAHGDGTALYAIGVFQGADAPTAERGRSNVALMDSILEIRTEAAVICSDARVIESALNQLRKEIHKAMMAPDALQSLRTANVVIDVMPGGAQEPEIDGESEEKKGTLVIEWGIHYRHSVTDASE